MTGWRLIVFNTALIFLICTVSYYLARMTVDRIITRLVKRTRTSWDDALLRRHFFQRLALVVPSVALIASIDIFNLTIETAETIIHRGAVVWLIFSASLAIDAFLSAGLDIYNKHAISRRLPMKVFLQVVKIVLAIVALILTLSAIAGEPPGWFLTGIGAFTAVLLLIFKDAILGLVAGVQLTANDMVRVGDWIEMPKYGADGDVIDVGLMTVKIQNFDKTISSIPTYTLVSDSFKNWRGMQESGGRRIKRALKIDMNSVSFLDEAAIQNLRKIGLIAGYIDAKQAEITEYNTGIGAEDGCLVNGRRMTNLGTFRAYIEAYLHNHPKIHQSGMTFLVRQLAPGDDGLPIELYVFTNDTNWVHYEGIQADIFDHLLAALPEFGLRIYQNPTGADIERALTARI